MYFYGITFYQTCNRNFQKYKRNSHASLDKLYSGGASDCTVFVNHTLVILTSLVKFWPSSCIGSTMLVCGVWSSCNSSGDHVIRSSWKCFFQWLHDIYTALVLWDPTSLSRYLLFRTIVTTLMVLSNCLVFLKDIVYLHLRNHDAYYKPLTSTRLLCEETDFCFYDIVTTMRRTHHNISEAKDLYRKKSSLHVTYWTI